MKILRHRIVLGLLAFVLVVMLARMFSLAYYDRDFLQDRGRAISERTTAIPTNRGIIFDRNGQPLAISVPVYSIWTDPGFDHIADEDLPALAAALEVTPKSLKHTLDEANNTRFVYLARRVSERIVDRVEPLALEGVRFETEYRRYYPAAEVAAHVVGFTNVDGYGVEGIEAAQDESLRGTPGTRRVLRDRIGRSLRDLELVEPPVFGQDVNLSIDLGLQYLAYRTLRDVVSQYTAKSASVVVISVPTGEILALANYPTYNPNDVHDRVPVRMRNRAIKDTYEPGSTIKPFAAIAALESQEFVRESVINTAPGSVQIGNKLVEDPVNYGALSLEMVLVKSSQVGIAKVALDLAPKAIYDVLIRGGFSEPPNSGLPNEAAGMIRDTELDREIGRATLAFGYGVRVSPLQLAKGYLTIATNGRRREVSIVKTPQISSGRETRVYEATHTAQLLDILQGVVSPVGTAPQAKIDGFQVAGKTGTVRKITNGEYDENRHIAWFAGIVPASNPQIVMVAVVNEPQGEVFSGGRVAAPLFATIAQHALQLIVPELIAVGTRDDSTS